ncbi:Hypothetical protein ING2D1G_1299 [Peptoniphilus sp. ING2-D1G]|nr:Hypothetical protein ING2D1G_1299 [Peptoniphilus sp. ING2-D1G]
MFSERLDAVMNVAGVSNSMLGRAVSMDGSYISRLRSGARKLPKKHDYVSLMSKYISGKITTDYQMQALLKLTGMSPEVFGNEINRAMYLEEWLLKEPSQSWNFADWMILSFAATSSINTSTHAQGESDTEVNRLKPYLYGNGGKRKAVEQFFQLILQEDKPQTLLLFPDEDMSWLYENASFSRKWAELFF